MITPEHLRESNLIEGIDDASADRHLGRSWDYLSDADDLTREVLLTTHLLATHWQLDDDAGRLRMVNVTIGGRACPDWRNVSGLVAEWLAGMRGWVELDPVAEHVKFEHIHPFIDGNGRAGRLLLWWHQIRLGQPPTLLRAAERFAYYEWFTGAAHGR